MTDSITDIFTQYVSCLVIAADKNQVLKAIMRCGEHSLIMPFNYSRKLMESLQECEKCKECVRDL